MVETCLTASIKITGPRSGQIENKRPRKSAMRKGPDIAGPFHIGGING